ncbi:MAG: hypothetical protein FJZ78_09340 [Bacteroidetes bacterium]|nr:hypothetical protein [Bacteroidota bacterium]
MRLGQLARKLDISPGDIEDFLEKYDLLTDGGTNARLSDDLVRKVVATLAPHRLSDFSGDLEKDEPLPPPAPSIDRPVEIESSPAEPVTPELPDTIKAPKIDLPGLKILGKIELPEPPKKPEKEIQPAEQLSVEGHRKSYRDRPREQRPWRNPMEEKRKREAKELERQKQEELRLKKEQRTMAYFNKQSKPKSSEKPRKKQKSEATSISAPPKPPKTVFGKIWRWLTQADA